MFCSVKDSSEEAAYKAILATTGGGKGAKGKSKGAKPKAKGKAKAAPKTIAAKVGSAGIISVEWSRKRVRARSSEESRSWPFDDDGPEDAKKQARHWLETLTKP